MRVIIATLLFISAAEAIRNLVGLPDEKSSRLHQLLEDGPIDPKKLTNPYNSKKTTARVAALLTKGPLNDHDSGSGEPGPGPPKGPDPLKTLAQSILHIGSALKELKEEKEQISKAKAWNLLYAVKFKDTDEVKKLLGKHIIAEHQRCDSIKLKYAKAVHQSVLYELLKGKDDILDFSQDVHEAFKYASMSSQVDVFEAFSYVVDKHDLKDHPGIKLIMDIGKSIAEAACDETLDGLFKTLGDLVEYVDPHGEYDLKDRFNLAIYSKNSPVCRPGYAHHHPPGHGPKSSLRDKFLDLMNRPDCKEVNFMRYIVDTVIEGYEVASKFASLHAIAKVHENAVISHVTYFLHHGHKELAYRYLGEYVLANVRGALTVGLAVEKHFAPEPSSTKSTTTAPESTTELVWTTEAPEGSATDEEVGSTTEASVKEKRVLRDHNGRVDEM